MNKIVYCFAVLLTLIIGSQPCYAARLKAYVNRFSVSIPENKEELKGSLQTLLMSRLNSEEIQAVENQSDADIQITGSYIVFGSVFSLDILAKTSSGVFIDRVFVQGDTQNELIPSVAEMARDLQRAILKWHRSLTAKTTENPLPSAAEQVIQAAVTKEFSQEPKPVKKVKKEPPSEARPLNMARLPETQKPKKTTEKPWTSEPLSGGLNGVASGRTIAEEGREIFVSGDSRLRYYLRGKSLQLLAEVVFEADEKVIGIDVADLDQNGVPEVYLSILKGSLPASRVYIPENNQLKMVKDNIPYLFRGVTEERMKKVFAQKLDAAGNFTGDIYELIKNGDSFTPKNPIQLPLFGNLYNFSRFIDSKGKRFFIVAHPEGYLLVYSKDKKQLWKSRDKFGGRESSPCPSENSDPSPALFPSCSFSPSQRILIGSSGEIIVSRNSGLMVSGTVRSYSKNNVMVLFWDGVSLKEKGRTEQSQNYLADFSYDAAAGELLLLEVEPKTNTGGERAGRIVLKKME